MRIGAAAQHRGAVVAEGAGKHLGILQYLFAVAAEVLARRLAQYDAKRCEVIHMERRTAGIDDGRVHACRDLVFAEQDGAVRSA